MSGPVKTVAEPDIFIRENNMNKNYKKLCMCKEEIKSRITDFRPEVALVLGTGLGGFSRRIEKLIEIDYSDIPGLPISTVVGHAGKFIFGYIEGIPVVVMNGRVHLYEGYSVEDVVLPIRIMGMLGAKKILLTNGVGAINRSYNSGDIMIIKDHVSFFVPSPLVGENITDLGTRFPDMSNVYRPEINKIIRNCGDRLNLKLHEGVYVQLTGPQYETPEEIKILSALGADVVGMSTVCEAIAANHMGMKVCGISLVGNMAAGIEEEILTHNPKSDVDTCLANLLCMTIKEISNIE